MSSLTKKIKREIESKINNVSNGITFNLGSKKERRLINGFIEGATNLGIIEEEIKKKTPKNNVLKELK